MSLGNKVLWNRTTIVLGCYAGRFLCSTSGLALAGCKCYPHLQCMLGIAVPFLKAGGGCEVIGGRPTRLHVARKGRCALAVHS